jgi:hypothetical protein
MASAAPTERAPLFGRARWIRGILSLTPEIEPVGWNRITICALGVLILLWAGLFLGTWAKWGNVTIDCGREMYVPWELMQGKTLYRDIWYIYGPAAPYWNSILFRIWGAHLEVLYWAGSVSALISSILLYLIGMRLSFWPAGWTAAAVLLAEAFSPNLFSFPLPYSFGAVYGSMAACFCLWCCVHGAQSSNRFWVLGASSAAATALLLKTEFGVGCAIAVLLLVIVRALQRRSLRWMTGDFLVCLPGLIICAATIAWMVSLRGGEFLLQENLAGLPGTWLQQRYGKLWLIRVMGSVTGRSLVKDAAALLLYLSFALSIRKCRSRRFVFLVGFICLLILVPITYYNWHVQTVVQMLFPRTMVLLNVILIPLVLLVTWYNPASSGFAGLLILQVGSAAIAVRTLFGTRLDEYSIYFNGPVILTFLILMSLMIFPRMPGFNWPSHSTELLPFVLIITVAFVPTVQAIRRGRHFEPLRTERGLIYLPPGMPGPYESAIQFMKTANGRGEGVLSVPEDMSLYFFAGVHCPSRVFQFTPGVVAPGKMTNDVIAGIESKHVRWLIWSNRPFPEYQTVEFGKDFDQPLGEYFRSHFRPVASLSAPKDEHRWPRGYYGLDWSAVIWERTGTD